MGMHVNLKTAAYRVILAVCALAATAALLTTDSARSETLLLRTLDLPVARSGAQLGWALAIADLIGDDSPDIVLTAPDKGPNVFPGPGTVLIFDGGTDNQVPVRTLVSPNAGGGGGGFGGSVAALPDRVIVGAPDETLLVYVAAGRGYLFDGSDGLHLRTFTSPNPQQNAQFGFSVDTSGVDVEGNFVVALSAPGEDVNGITGAGAVHLYDGTTGNLLRTLVSPNPEKDGEFGYDVAMRDATGDDTDDVLIGAPGESVLSNIAAGGAYLFDGSDGLLIRTFTSPNPQAGGNFGLVAFNPQPKPPEADPPGADLAIGAPGETVLGYVAAGRAYQYDANGNLIRTSTSFNPQAGGKYGRVAFNPQPKPPEADLLVGAWGETVNGVPGAGRFYQYDSSGRLVGDFSPPKPQLNAHFGLDVVGFNPQPEPPLIVVGCPDCDTTNASDEGRAFVFDARYTPNELAGDRDGDGCTATQEQQTNPGSEGAGGRRSDKNFWDFFDTWATGSRTRNIDGFDIGDVVGRFGTIHGMPLPTKEEALVEALTPPGDTSSYHTGSDRDTPDPAANVWNLGPPSGNIDGFDIGFVVVQFGHTCIVLP